LSHVLASVAPSEYDNLTWYPLTSGIHHMVPLLLSLGLLCFGPPSFPLWSLLDGSLRLTYGAGTSYSLLAEISSVSLFRCRVDDVLVNSMVDVIRRSTI
jgi:hypothetical protein